jgi:hypothetical protein
MNTTEVQYLTLHINQLSNGNLEQLAANGYEIYGRLTANADVLIFARTLPSPASIVPVAPAAAPAEQPTPAESPVQDAP